MELGTTNCGTWDTNLFYHLNSVCGIGLRLSGRVLVIITRLAGSEAGYKERVSLFETVLYVVCSELEDRIFSAWVSHVSEEHCLAVSAWDLDGVLHPCPPAAGTHVSPVAFRFWPVSWKNFFHSQ
jgi:hypothetical protein